MRLISGWSGTGWQSRSHSLYVKTSEVVQAAQNACAELAGHDHPITFTAVANLTGLARSALRRNPRLREFISVGRYQSGHSGKVVLSEEIATLRLTVETLAHQVQKHKMQIRQLSK